MRIAVVHSFYSSASPSGENQAVERQVEALRADGHEVELVSKYTDKEEDRLLYRASAALAAAGLAGASPVRRLQEFDPDIVHVHNLFPNWGTRWLADWRGPVVSTVHNFRPVCARGTLWRDGGQCTECLDGSSLAAIRHRCYRDSRAATVPLAYASRSKGIHSPLLQRSDVAIVLNDYAASVFSAPERIECIPNFVDDVLYDAKTCESDYWIYAGRLTREKGVDWLVNNWPTGFRLKIAGSGPLEDHVREMQNDSVVYLGRVPSDSIRDEIKGATGIVVPSMWPEGIPTVALEALQAGTPVVVSSLCASARDLTLNGCGAIFDPRPRVGGEPGNGQTASTLRSALERVRDAGVTARSLARVHFEQTYSKESWLKKINEVYTSVL
jgi:glycosyltransferase involved in cell wall biosynthesis